MPVSGRRRCRGGHPWYRFWQRCTLFDGGPIVHLNERDLSALRFAASFVRGFERDLEERHPDDPNPITGTREGEATSDVLAAIVARAERSQDAG